MKFNESSLSEELNILTDDCNMVQSVQLCKQCFGNNKWKYLGQFFALKQD